MAAVSAAEAALLGMREHKIRAYALDSPFHRSRLTDLFERRESLFNALLLLGAVLHLGAAVCCLLTAPRWAAQLGVPTAFLLPATLVLILLVFDAIPKVLALSHPALLLRNAATALLLVEFLMRPVSSAMGNIADAIAGRIAPRNLSPSPRIEDDEVGTMVKMRHAAGELPEWEAEVIHEIVKLGDKTAKDVMTPRTDVETIDASAPLESIRAAVAGCSHRLLPAYRDEPDHIVGVLDVESFLFDDDLQGAIRDAHFVPETMAAFELFEADLAEPHRMMIVLDEYGGFEGVATRNDIIEDLVRDAVPPDSGLPEIHKIGDDRYLAFGGARLEDLEDEIGIELAADGIDTIGGLVSTRCGRIPSLGEAVEMRGFSFTVKQISEKRIEELLIEPASRVGSKEGGGHA